MIVFLVAEFTVRALDARRVDPTTYPGAMKIAARESIDFIFTGTSRTAGGIALSVWDEELSRHEGRAVRSLNLAQPYSGGAPNYFGLRELADRRARSLAGCTVFFELSAGLPAFTRKWDDPWYFEGNAQIVVDYMRPADLARFLSTDEPFDRKADIVFRYFTRTSRLLSLRRSLQRSVSWRGLAITRRLLTALGGEYRENLLGAKLPPIRVLRTDEHGVRLQRERIRARTSRDALARQKPLRPWKETIVCAAAIMLKERGIAVAFHEVPAPSFAWTVNETETRRLDRADFEAWAKGNDIPIIRSHIAVTDDDFPDLSHLARSRREEYTRALAADFVAREGKGGREPPD